MTGLLPLAELAAEARARADAAAWRGDMETARRCDTLERVYREKMRQGQEMEVLF